MTAPLNDVAASPINPTPDSLATLLDEIVATLKRYLVLPEHAAEAIALWIAHTYVVEAFYFTPRLVLTSAVMRCGKTTTLSLIQSVAWRPLSVSNASPASIFRIMDLEQPTLLMDEADGWLVGDQVLRTILNAGYSRASSRVLRVDTETFQPKEFDAFGPLAIAMIGEPDGTILDRSIVISLRRRTWRDEVDRFRSRQVMEQADPLRRRLQRWGEGSAANLKGAEPSTPSTLDDRAADLWEPLLAIADSAGDSWPERARAAAVTLSSQRLQSEPDIRMRLLEDVHAILGEFDGDRLASQFLVSRLVAVEAAPWSECNRGGPLTSRGLANLLRPFGLKPITIRVVGGATPKGYKREDFERLFELYLDPAQDATTPQPAE